jgi:hypothetical protein
MNQKLREVKINIREIEKFCKSRPVPSVPEVVDYLEREKLEEYKEFALNFIGAVHSAEWLLHINKINKSRV